jgi:hypothetical protein
VACLLMDQDEMSNLYRGPSIDAPYQVSVHLAEGFQRRRLKCEKLTDDRRRMPSDGKSSPNTVKYFKFNYKQWYNHNRCIHTYSYTITHLHVIYTFSKYYVNNILFRHFGIKTQKSEEKSNTITPSAINY